MESSPLHIHDILEKLYEVRDPELGMSVVDLGLVYGITIGEDLIAIKVSLTYPGCPYGPVILEEIQNKLSGFGKVTVEIVWEPAWNQQMMAEETLEELRFAGRIRG